MYSNNLCIIFALGYAILPGSNLPPVKPSRNYLLKSLYTYSDVVSAFDFKEAHVNWVSHVLSQSESKKPRAKGREETKMGEVTGSILYMRQRARGQEEDEMTEITWARGLNDSNHLICARGTGSNEAESKKLRARGREGSREAKACDLCHLDLSFYLASRPQLASVVTQVFDFLLFFFLQVS